MRFIPGIMPSRSPIGPSRLTWRSWSRKSSKSNCPSARRRPMASASSSLMFSWARSMSDSTSPMPRMRPARRSGSNGSRSGSFSPVPRNLMGTPVTWRTLSAAPPRASPSILVMIRPVSADAGVEPLRHVDRLLARHGVDHQQDVRRSGDHAHLLELLHEVLVDLQAAGRVHDGDVVGLLPGVLDRVLGDAGGGHTAVPSV